MTGDLDVIKAGLIDRMEEVCARLLPHGKVEAGQWVSFNPVTGDHRAGRVPALKVRLRGGVVGAWKDWRSGDSGDALRLVAYILATDTSGAMVWGRDFLGLRTMTRADRENMRKVAAQKAQTRERDDARRREEKLLNADRLFNARQSEKDIGPCQIPFGVHKIGENTTAETHALAYFAARNCALEDIETFTAYSTRVAPAVEWWKGANWKRDSSGRQFKDQRGPLYPAILSAMRNRMGIVTCCHFTFLDPNRPAKAPVEPAKLMYGEALGSVIEIATGPSGKPFWMTDEPAPLIIAEGRETAQSFAAAGVPARIWAAGSLAGVGKAPVDLACVSWVLFARDNNTGNPQAQKQFEQALAGLESHGKRVVVEASHVGDDFNDLAKGEE
ncbi:hypothetical protein [Mesorhizobium sp. M8A.F.Ca.ET.021.01.1.1]|uniref:DUF7146 domain-containing protein n=1 Tax=Mesorhizobium sp. M8A.F.Ca.ET.021.01.1.1 TaxID=2496757 RepID=UPI000FCA3A00|nr:hypothetical protein [Mesorhizobium sp. M8A.F.Ca.ET.021.01.1.1]RUW45668.1 hypothetical protein EOA36_27680 [Mesorhizobium sp. M8A.F.Ca.ET.021.01.1.1]